MRRLSRVKVLSESDKQLMLDLKSIIASFVPNATVILYGSAARGQRGPESDYDVLVLLDEPIDKVVREEMRSAIYEMELDREVVMSILIETNNEWVSPLSAVSPFYENVQKDGLVV